MLDDFTRFDEVELDARGAEPLTRKFARLALRAWVAGEALRIKAPLRNDRNEEIDPEMQAMLKGLERFEERRGGLRDVGRARADADRYIPLFDFPPTPMGLVKERVIRGPCRAWVYWPKECVAPAPACVFFHGGGFVLGSPRSHDGVVRFLAARSRAVFVSVDYRLAPEHKLPCAHEDARIAFEWVYAKHKELGIDPKRIALVGDSAGANLALSTAIHSPDGPRARAVVAIYPPTDFRRLFASHQRLGEGFFLTKRKLDWFLERIVDSSRALEDPRLSVLLAPRLAHLPYTHVVTAGFDPLRDEGEAFVERLRREGVPSSHREEKGLIHGFFSMGGVVREA
ncbi:MAG: alpha/beta hydrolase, partial [Deltaproteobacteria bacterium]|nr:alpha/beta hydrolase [Deltaproteobacteria bacterium]